LIEKGQTVTLVLSTEKEIDHHGEAARKEEGKRERKLLTLAKDLTQAPSSETTPPWLSQLVLAADQFLVKRSLPGQTSGKTVIAGYHWFCDWGRDTMIAIPGLALSTGRADVSRQILLAFSQYVDGGMLPNNFPDSGAAPEYNTIDATLWYFEAVRQYFAVTQDLETLKKLFPILAKIVATHLKGTRYTIHAD